MPKSGASVCSKGARPKAPVGSKAAAKSKKRKGPAENDDDDDETQPATKKVKVQVGVCSCSLCSATSQDMSTRWARGLEVVGIGLLEERVS